jgi:hypothetical protein
MSVSELDRRWWEGLTLPLEASMTVTKNTRLSSTLGGDILAVGAEICLRQAVVGRLTIEKS